MAGTFAEKFEEALKAKRETQPGFGLRTLARKLAKDDPVQAETIRRRLHKYRPRPGGGAAEVTPTPSTRREIEDALGLPPDALLPDPVAEPEEMVALLMPSSALRRLVREEIRVSA